MSGWTIRKEKANIKCILGVMVRDEDPRVQTVTCDLCGLSVTLRVEPLSPAERAWRAFVCPGCRRPNFVRLAGRILQVLGDQQES